MASTSCWHSAFLGSAGSFWSIQQAQVRWALGHSPGTCSCCCSSGLLRSASIKHQRSNTGCQAGGKNRKIKSFACLQKKKKNNSERDVATLSPTLLNERCAISLCISSCYFTMGCLNGTGYKHHHPSAKELKNSVAAGHGTVLFSQKSGRIIIWDSQSWGKTVLMVQGRCPLH